MLPQLEKKNTNKPLQNASMIDVDFEWFSPSESVDFHGLKNLLKQLFDVDNQLFDLSELTNLILEQPALGSTVKTEGEESDPFAFLTVLNMHEHREKNVIKQLTSYLIAKATADPALSSLKTLLAPESKAQVGLVLSERFINMPHQIVPPLYTMLQDELAEAVKQKEPYEFTHYLFISKCYTEVASKLDVEDNPPSKKSKAANSKAEIFYFHPEDEMWQRHAAAHAGFDYNLVGADGASDAKRAFQELGIRPQGNAILIEASKFGEAVKAVGDYLSG
jgi:protein BCP1